MERKIKKENNEKHWDKFLIDAKENMESSCGSSKRVIKLWHISTADGNRLMNPSANIAGAFEATLLLGKPIEQVISVNMITDNIITVETKPYDEARARILESIKKENCSHQFFFLDKSGYNCVVCGLSISADMLSEQRGKGCQQCGISVHVNCEAKLYY